ncbi:type II toxin-antitoxin system VapC family toxin [Serratia symbiotica]|uniref:type II toxin-antitoxin system VapC family toxin n=1 Tax=Serratia symbiotica TaxID=138074 RepID=UPI001D62246F|nr:type II toxin-antitoxin system VapC family toxin [Serratia symbiotica]NIG87741.1 type II toxin-antitoxin system VapC family toxin [Serratia symbiotica]USS95734.1 type II toxin-antitoxin system VapC family toxin [Serratia symbiotica]
MIVLDTNVVLELLRPAPHYNVLKWLDEQDTYQFYLSAIAVAELYTGIFCMPYGKRQIELQNNLSEMLQEEFPEKILPFDIGCAMQYAELMGTNHHRGTAISIPDSQIAATCLHYGATLATRNTKDFIHSGVTLINPWLMSNNTRHLHEDAAEYAVMNRKS